jgi:hypothetical protein
MRYTYQTLTVRPVVQSEATVSVMLLISAAHEFERHSPSCPEQALCVMTIVTGH